MYACVYKRRSGIREQRNGLAACVSKSVMPASPKPEPELVYLFSSAARTPYARDILNAICLPDGYVLQFRYLPIWTDPDLLNDPNGVRDELDGREAIIVFADMPGAPSATNYRFYPIRLARIVDPHFVGPVLYVPMVLREFVDYGRADSGRADAWHSQIAAFPKSPRLSGEKRRDSFIFKERVDSRQYKVSGSTPLPNWAGAETGWESVVEQIGSTEKFRLATFFRIEGLYNDNGEALQPQLLGHRSWYRVPFNVAFTMRLLFYHDRQHAQFIEGRTLRIIGNSDLFSGDVGRVIPADYQYNRIDARLLTRRRFERDYTNIRIEPAGWSPSSEDVADMVRRFAKYLAPKNEPPGEEALKQAENRIKEAVTAGRYFVAQPELLMELVIPWSSVLFASVLFGIGTVLLALPSDAVKNVIQFFLGPIPSVLAWAAFIRTIGGLFGFGGILYAFHKWPLK